MSGAAPNARTVAAVKAVHSALFLLFSASVLLLLASAISGRIGIVTLAAGVTIVVEGSVLIANRMACPLTTLAERLGAEDGRVTHLFCPDWFAPRVFQVYAVLTGLALAVIGVRLLA